jgi:hypothetical protein
MQCLVEAALLDHVFRLQEICQMPLYRTEYRVRISESYFLENSKIECARFPIL